MSRERLFAYFFAIVVIAMLAFFGFTGIEISPPIQSAIMLFSIGTGLVFGLIALLDPSCRVPPKLTSPKSVNLSPQEIKKRRLGGLFVLTVFSLIFISSIKSNFDWAYTHSGRYRLMSYILAVDYNDQIIAVIKEALYAGCLNWCVSRAVLLLYWIAVA